MADLWRAAHDALAAHGRARIAQSPTDRLEALWADYCMALDAATNAPSLAFVKAVQIPDDAMLRVGGQEVPLRPDSRIAVQASDVVCPEHGAMVIHLVDDVAVDISCPRCGKQPIDLLTERKVVPQNEPVNNGFVCNRLGEHHRLGSMACPACENDEARDARFGPGNDVLWGPGNWVRCPTCPHDHLDREVYHHKDAHG